MMDIRNLIAELLEEHDCVILPGLGGFIGNYAPARIDPVNHRFLPPFKKLLFNINLRHNDGLLIHKIVTKSGKGYEESSRLTQDFIASLQQQIKSPRGIIFPRIGRLFLDREGNIQFEQDLNTNLLPESFGLFSFVAPPIERNGYTGHIGLTVNHIRQQDTIVRPLVARSLKWAAFLAIPVSVAAILGAAQLRKGNNEPLSRASILGSVFSRFSSASLVEKKNAPETASDYIFTYEPAPSAFSEPVEEDVQIQNTMPVQEETELPPADYPYAVIIGAFRIHENAEKAVRDAHANGMMDARIYDQSKSGLWRVAMGTYNTPEEAGSALSAARSGGCPGAWLLEK